MAPTPTTIFIINSPDAPAHLAANFGLDPGKTWTVDATGISLAELGKNIPNTPMLGALIKITDVVPIDELAESVKKLREEVAQAVIEGNIKAIDAPTRR